MSERSVAVVVTGFGTGGAATQLSDLANALREQYEFHLLSLMEVEPTDRIHALGLDVSSLGLRRGAVHPRAFANLVSWMRRHQPDVIQGWQYHANWAATVARWCWKRHVPVVWSVHHSILDLSNDKVATRALIRLGAALSRTTAAVVYCSKASARQHERIGYDARRTVVIPNGIDCEVFHPRPDARSRLHEELSIPADRTVIGHVARFHPMKDYGNLIAAVAHLIAAGGDVHLVMVGADVEPGNRELAAAIRAAGIGSRVSLLGKRMDIPHLMAGFDLLALSSSTGEAFPIVLGEAMASGVPCVATDVGDSSWIIGDSGVVVPPRDSAALATGLAQLSAAGREARRRYGEAARARVVENFNLPDVARRYDTLYEGLRRRA